MLWALHITTFVFFGLHLMQGSTSDRICASLGNNKSHIYIDKDRSVERDETKLQERCKEATSCYTLWKEVSDAFNNSAVTALSQGCWESSGKDDCGSEMCVASHKQTRALNNTRFCCCSEDLCNANYSESVGAADYLDVTNGFIYSSPTTSPEHQTVVILAACTLTLVAVILAMLGISRRWQDPDKGSPSDNVHLMEAAHRTSIGQIVDEIKLSSIVGKGRYGTVWMGYLEGEQVAVKVFPASYKQFYFNERDIYCLPFMEHPSLLTYFGCSDKISQDTTEYLLVLSFCSNGCLQDYIRLQTLDFYTFCRMALSIAKGLAFLHTDVHKGDKIKPCVCHRDLNTRNILVRGDLNCVLCDLGLAIKLSGSHYYTLEEEQHAETKSISDVGTLRYMAPEVLEGAVNLRDCESSLKQIDVFALGLVLWELATRCTTICQPGCDPSPYRMPFEAEIGQHPSFDQMQVLVTRNKARPLFPETWLDCAATRLLRETIDDCWDQDAEARLTALCVEERLLELSTLNLKGPGQIGLIPTGNHTQGSLPLTTCSINNNVTTQYNEEKEGPDSNVSEGTVDTLLTLSPSDPGVEAIANTKDSNTRITQAPQIQPYQGRNPCMERNLMRESCSPNDLVDRSTKHDRHSFSETQSLVSADHLNSAPRVNTPIPFVQNAVFANQTVNTIPKQHNVPGNGTSTKHLGEILTKPLKKMLGTKKNASDKQSKSCMLKTQTVKETEVSVGEQQAITAVLGNNKDNIGLVLDLKNDLKIKDKNLVSNMKMIISPFEDISDESSSVKSAERPSSLMLANSKNNHVERKKNLDHIFTDGKKGKLKDLADRIKTPGDVPPSVRRNRGKSVMGETRFSLYDDRMMEGIHLNDTDMISTVTTHSFPSDIQLSDRPVKVDSSF